MKYLDRIANVAIIVAVAVFLTVVIRGGYLHRVPGPPRAPTSIVGSTINLPGVRFPSRQYSLVLGISASCHFCEASLPFYRQLTEQLQGKVNLIAVLPQSQNEADAFIKKAGLSGTRVISENLDSIGVDATPTLLLIDGSGKVKNSWVGEQDKVGEEKILAAALPRVAAAVPRS